MLGCCFYVYFIGVYSLCRYFHVRGGNLLVRTTAAARLNLPKFNEICKKTEGTLKKSIKKTIAAVRALKQKPADQGPHGGAHGAPWAPMGPPGGWWLNLAPGGAQGPHGAPGPPPG